MYGFNFQPQPSPETFRPGPLDGTDRIVIGYSPKSSNGEEKSQEVSNFLQVTPGLPPHSMFEISNDPVEMQERFLNDFDAVNHQIVGIYVGGDGGWNLFAPVLVDPSTPEEYANIPWLPAGGGGSGQNLLKDLLKHTDMEYLVETLRNGSVIKAYPDSAKISHPDQEPTIDFFFTVAGFSGVTPLVSWYLNQEPHREWWLRNLKHGLMVADSYIAIKSLFRSKHSEFVDENGEVEKLLELLILNSRQVGHAIRSKNVSLETNPHLVKVKNKLMIPMTLARLATGHSKGVFVDNFSEFSIGDNPVIYQLDGETERDGKPRILMPGSTVRIEQLDRSVRFIRAPGMKSNRDALLTPDH